MRILARSGYLKKKKKRSGYLLAKGARTHSFPVRGYNAGSPLEWAEVELMADLTLDSKGQLHSPTLPLSKITLVLSNPESSPTRQASLCSPSSLEVAQSYPEVV